MANFKVNISEKNGKTHMLESSSEFFLGKALKEKINGEDIAPELKGYEFEISGASDTAGFTHMENLEGVGLKKVLLTYGKGMKKRPKGGKKKLSNKKPKGLRLRKTARGKVLSEATAQINLKVLKTGAKSLQEIFSAQNQPRTKENRKTKRTKSKEKPVEDEKAESQE